MEVIFITFKYKYRKQIIIGLLILITISISTVFILLNNKGNNKKTKKEEIVIEKEIKTNIEQKNKEEFKVDIKGQINNPGIYTLEKDSRVIDVIEKAGGLTEIADTSVINLSKKITDEMVIIIYSHEEVLEFGKTKEKEEIVLSKCRENETYSIENNACISNDNNTSNSNGKISINKASKEELMTLPGIGESKANEIIKYREKNGDYKSIEEIKNVTGIGESLFDQIKENITT